MGDVLIQLGPLAFILIGLLGFLIGLISNFIVDGYRDSLKKAILIDLFVTDIYRNWRHVEDLRAVPYKPYFVRIRPQFKGINELTFHGEPEFKFEVHNLALYETKGLELINLLSKNCRIEFWEVISLMRDAESVRKIIIDLPVDDKDLGSYKKMFVGLIEKLSEKLAELCVLLQNERPKIIGGRAY